MHAEFERALTASGHHVLRGTTDDADALVDSILELVDRGRLTVDQPSGVGMTPA